MDQAANRLRGTARRVLAVQGVLTVLCCVPFALWQGIVAGLAAFYGGAIAALMTLVLAWRVGQMGRVLRNGEMQGSFPLFMGVLERFALAIAGLAIGMKLLQLPPMPMLVVFALAHLSYVVVGMQRR